MINECVLVGRLTKDPEMRYTPSGVATTSFTIAVNRTFTNQEGEREADFIPIVTWRKTAENVANFMKKGSLVAVVGRIQVRNYENNEGRRVYVTEIVAENVQFLDNRNVDNPSGNQNQNQNQGGNQRNQGNQGGYNQGNQRNQGGGNRQNQGGYNQNGGGYNQPNQGTYYQGNGNQGNNRGGNQGGYQGQGNNRPYNDDPFANDGQPIDISDDDLPF